MEGQATLSMLHAHAYREKFMIGTSSAPPIDDIARLRSQPAASWGAIIAGAAVAVALSLVMVTLGAGLGFASLASGLDGGTPNSTFTLASTIWLIVTQWISAAVGGYIAGRLRHRWLATHPHEVLFRDTAHGLITWSVATLVVATVLAKSMTGLVGGRGAAVADPSDAHNAALAALYTALSLFIGAFIASVSAAIGGRIRDEHL
jgi:hypothetical protein